MFIVYSPEGRSFSGAVHQLPVLKVDPAKRVNEPSEAGLDNMSMEPDHSDAHFHQDQALKQYQQVKDVNERTPIVKAHEVMSHPVVTCLPDNTIDEVWKIMQSQGIYHVPVLNEGMLVGILARSDLLASLLMNSQEPVTMLLASPVSSIMHTQVVATGPDTHIRDVAVALTNYHIGAVPIVTHTQELVGIITLSDLVARLAKSPPIELYT